MEQESKLAYRRRFGGPDAAIAESAEVVKPTVAPGLLKIAFGVFLGNLAFGIVAVLVYGFVTGAIMHW